MDILARFGPIQRAFGSRNYVYFLAGATCSSIGTWMQRIAVGWLTWELTRSGTWLGIMALAEVLPAVGLAPFAGALADRVDKLKLLRFLQVLSMGQAIVLAGLTMGGWITIELLLALALFQGFAVSIQQPARLAIAPALVERELLSPAIALNSLSFNLARFLGPAVAGPIIVWGGVGPAFVANALSYVVFIAALSRIKLVIPEPSRRSRRLSEMPSEIASGYRYAMGHPGIRSLFLLLVIVAVFARPFHELLPGFADHVFGRGADALAMMTSATGLGAMVAGLWLASRGEVRGLTALALRHSLLLPISLLIFASLDSIWLALPCLALAGFSLIVVAVCYQTLIQAAVEPGMRGRVLGLYGMLGRGGPALGALAMGYLSGGIGLQWPLAAGAAICILAWVMLRSRQRLMAETLEVEPPPYSRPAE